MPQQPGDARDPFAAFLESLQDEAGILAREELVALVRQAAASRFRFLREQAGDLRRWTQMLAENRLTPEGYKELVRGMAVLRYLDELRLETETRAAADRFAEGIRRLVIGGLFRLL